MFSQATALLPIILCCESLKPRGECWLYPVWWLHIRNVNKYSNLLPLFSYCHYKCWTFPALLEFQLLLTLTLPLESSTDTGTMIPGVTSRGTTALCAWAQAQTFPLLQFCHFHSHGTAAWLESHASISWPREGPVSQELTTTHVKE